MFSYQDPAPTPRCAARSRWVERAPHGGPPAARFPPSSAVWRRDAEPSPQGHPDPKGQSLALVQQSISARTSSPVRSVWVFAPGSVLCRVVKGWA